MQPFRWTNPSHPQTLQIAVFLFYINGVFGVLSPRIATLIGFVSIAAQIASGIGIANSKRWGYRLGVVAAAFALLPIILFALDEGVFELLDVRILIAIIFPVALFAALVHPLSREYQRIWFE